MSDHDREHESAIELTEHLQMLRDVVRRQSMDNPQDCTQTRPVFPSKYYGDVNVSKNAHAHLGDIYRFCDNDHAQQQKVLQDYKEQIEKFVQQQSDQSAQLEQALALIAEISQSIRVNDIKSSSVTQGSMLSRQDLLAGISVSDDERSPDQTLQLAKSFARRLSLKPTSFVDPKSYVPQLNWWLTATSSVLLHLSAELLARDHATDIAVQLAARLKESGFRTVWFLPISRELKTISAVTRSIIIQLVEFLCDNDITISDPIDLTMLGESGNEDTWMELLRVMLYSVRQCFLVVDLPNQTHRWPDWSQRCDQMICTLRDAVAQAFGNGHIIKVLIITRGIQLDNTSAQNGGPEYRHCLLKATPINLARARQTAAHQEGSLTKQLQNPVLSLD